MLPHSIAHNLILYYSSSSHVTMWGADSFRSSFEMVIALSQALSPEGLLKAVGKGRRQTYLDRRRQDSMVNAIESLMLSVLIDVLAVPAKMITGGIGSTTAKAHVYLNRPGV